MKSMLPGAVIVSLALCFCLSGCSQSDSQKLTDDAKATGEAAKKTANDVLNDTQKAADKLSDDARKAADSPTAKDLQAKTKRGAEKVVDKTKELAQQVEDDSKKQPSKP